MRLLGVRSERSVSEARPSQRLALCAIRLRMIGAVIDSLTGGARHSRAPRIRAAPDPSQCLRLKAPSTGKQSSKYRYR
jgi:hypothetical protein